MKLDCMTNWIELETRLRKKRTIDESMQVAINKERTLETSIEENNRSCAKN